MYNEYLTIPIAEKVNGQTLNTKSFYIGLKITFIFKSLREKEVINVFRACKQSQEGYISFLPSFLNF